jgi:hypothetical protein
MADGMDAETLSLELDVFARRAGIEIPPERREALLEGFKDLKRLLITLHRPRDATSEIAGLFDPRSIMRIL